VGATSIEDDIYPMGGFGFGERPAKPAGCGLPICDSAQILPTDLYCRDHDRFLPFSRLTSAGRVFAVALVAFLVYGSVELTALLDSAVPVSLAYILVALGAIALPLRNFLTTCWVTVVLWLAISGLALSFQFTDTHFHAVTAATFLLVVMTATTLLSMFYAGPLDEDAVGIASGLVARGVIGVIGAVAIGFASALAGKAWRAEGLPVGRVAFFAAVILGAGSIVTAIVGGFVHGAMRIRRDVRGIQGPRRLKPVTWRVSVSSPRPRQGRSPIDRIAEVVTLALHRTSAMVTKALVSVCRVSVNFLLTAANVLVARAVDLINWGVKALVLTLRCIAAGVADTIWLGYRALVSAVMSVLWAATFVLVPVGALAGAGLFLVGSAEETRRYIAAGSLSVLLRIIVLQLMALGLATVAWITLASQPWRESQRSAQRSANGTAPYLLLFVAAGGWLLGLPGTLGHGPIRVGFLTLTSTGLIVVALLLRPLLNRVQSQAGDDAGDHPAQG
jgi:hypothetical protein